MADSIGVGLTAELHISAPIGLDTGIPIAMQTAADLLEGLISGLPLHRGEQAPSTSC